MSKGYSKWLVIGLRGPQRKRWADTIYATSPDRAETFASIACEAQYGEALEVAGVLSVRVLNRRGVTPGDVH